MNLQKLKSSDKGTTELMNALLLILVIVIVGTAVVIPVIGTFIRAATNLGSTTQLTLNGTENTTVTLAFGGITADSETLTLWNGTEDYTLEAGVNYTMTLGLQSSTAGTYELISIPQGVQDDAVMARFINITYGYAPAGYLNNSGARAILNLIPLFIALAILITVISLTKIGGM